MNKFIGDENKEELKIKYNAENLKEINEKLQAQIDFLNEENHKLQGIEYFHTHRCREEEIKKLDSQIASLMRENEFLKNQIESINSSNRKIMNKEKMTTDALIASIRHPQEHCKASTETLHDGNSPPCSVCLTCKVPSQGLQMAGKQGLFNKL